MGVPHVRRWHHPADDEGCPERHRHPLLQPWQLVKTKKVVTESWGQPGFLNDAHRPTDDEALMTISELTGKPIPESSGHRARSSGRYDHDSHTWLHGKKYALYGDPFRLRLDRFLMEPASSRT